MILADLFEDSSRNVVVIYPGRFQPFTKGHKAVYDYLCQKYGTQNVFITTSNKVEPPHSPFNFQEKLEMMKLAGVAPSRVVQSAQPYRANEIVSTYNPSSTVVLFAVSEKDMAEDPRFSFKPKKDGSSSYFQPLQDLSKAETLDKHGYITTVPTFNFTILGKPMRSATEVRAQFASADESTQKVIVRDLFGAYTDAVYNLMREKLVESTTEVYESADGIEDQINLVKTDLDSMQTNIDNYVRLMAAAEKMAVQHAALHPKHSDKIQQLYQNFVAKLRNSTDSIDVATGYNQYSQKIKNESASVGGTSAGGISTVIGGTGDKNKSQVGSLFGGSFIQPSTKKKRKTKMKSYEFIGESTGAHDAVVKAVLDSIRELISQGHAEVATYVLTNAVAAKLREPFMPKDLVLINHSSKAVQHYIDSINPTKVKFSTDMLTVKNEDPEKEKEKAQNIVSKMATRAAMHKNKG